MEDGSLLKKHERRYVKKNSVGNRVARVVRVNFKINGSYWIYQGSVEYYGQRRNSKIFGYLVQPDQTKENKQIPSSHRWNL